MSNLLIFSLPRRRKSPISGDLFTPADLSGLALLRTVASIAADLIADHDGMNDARPVLQRRNTRSLLRKVKILVSFLKVLGDGDFDGTSLLPPSATTCLKELYILIPRSRILLDFCSQSSRLWLLLQNPKISGHFQHLNIQIATLLDVFPPRELKLSADVREQVELLHRQCRRSKLFVDPQDEALRRNIFSFLDEFQKGGAPDSAELRASFIYGLGIRDAEACRCEIEYLEELIYSQDEDVDPLFLGGVVALIRYCRFLLFGSVEEGERRKKKPSFQEFVDSWVVIPEALCCPISLELMRDPVITSYGQTYDRASIIQWMEEGHFTSPKSSQMLSHTDLIPNRALRNLIAQWCLARGVPYDPPDGYAASAERMAAACASRAATVASQKTAEILVEKLSVGSDSEKAVAAREIRGKEKLRSKVLKREGECSHSAARAVQECWRGLDKAGR